MSEDALVVISFPAGVSGGPVTVSRIVGDNPSPDIAAEYLIDEYLAITGSFSSGDPIIEWTFDKGVTGDISGDLNTVFQYDGAARVGTYPVVPANDLLTITGVTGFSTWFAGNGGPMGVSSWHLLE